MPIPNFDHNSVLPPHLGSPTRSSELSPYPCTSLELCDRFSTSPERIAILKGFLDFRSKLDSEGLKTGFQWLDGSFLEDIEAQEARAPRDLDLVTISWGYPLLFYNNLITKLPEFRDNDLAKKNYHLDHYPLIADQRPEVTVNYSRYWVQLFSHNRNSVWKGMLQIQLDTPAIDKDALDLLNSK